jgi:molybdopterin-guanine dinucleotide biosynthesis protein A
MNVAAVILAGGQSRRMGRDKAWLEVDGLPLIARGLWVVREAGIKEIFVSGRTGVDYYSLECLVLSDGEPGLGPLGGIERALDAVNAPLLLVLAVDLPKITAAFLRTLMGHCNSGCGAVPELNGQLEPLAAIYPKRCHQIVRNCLHQSRRAARDFAAACLREGAIRRVEVSKEDAACFENWNTPSDAGGSPRWAA